ncbi:hypothetical protein CgunFtcFv8_003748 [Champsocephalus gunnari]|uniref:TNFR-Cys domain-containing protein n=1 Tax=Champsocephalus gunnari TaxID=52237 RepID=A0AAN8E2E7_CHAGU|nr:hypothetical protein CgunFtcFv8_003748 [Champsocephalus gunnari]
MSCLPEAALHHGKCISQCPAQHYLHDNSRCRVCHSSCSSCRGPSVSQCTLCPVGVFFTRVSVWRPVGKDFTPRTPPATIVTPLAGPVWDPWPQTASAV